METENKQALTERDVLLYQDCPRCFFLSYKHHIERPGISYPSQGEFTKDTSIIDEIQKNMTNGAPLQNPHCVYCKYRQLVRTTGIENELTA